MTVTSGLAQVGKSQLALNLALEMVRRGRWVGLFHDQVDSGSIDQLLSLPPPVYRDRHDGEERPGDVLRRGYQGADIISCRLPLSEWAHGDPERIARCVNELDIDEGYDDLIIDTSGMPEHELLACCLASAIVIMVVTPEAATQAGAFALLRILKLNGYSGSVHLLVNKARYAVDAGDIHQLFSERVKSYLGMDIQLLEVMLADAHIPLSEHSRQAFSTVFPESEASGCLVVIADKIEDLPPPRQPQSVRAYWGRVRELLATPVQLPGHAVLESGELAGEAAGLPAKGSVLFL
jgi:flagellar biosynthesis protein FlhG